MPTLVSWNVNSLKARLPRVLELLAEHRPDVVCLQETKCEPEAFPHAELSAAGYAAADHSGGRWAGVAILAPLSAPPRDARRGLEGEPAAHEARYLEATAAGLRVASVYVPNGRAVGTPPFEEKLRFLDALARRAPALDALLGDLNVTRSDLDVYDPAAFAGSTHVTAAERERLEALIAAGLGDGYRELHPGESGYTWWDYRQGHFHRGIGLRIDYALLAGEAGARLEECGIDRSYRKGPKPSDHAPLLARIAAG